MKDDKSKLNAIQAEEVDNLTVDWINEPEQSEKNSPNTKKNKLLAPVKHPQQDFFIADIFNAISFQTDIASLEFPLFSLKAGDKEDKHYSVNGFKIDIRSSSLGHANIHDKDIWIYCISKIMQAKKEDKNTSRIVHFTIYDYLKMTNRSVGGKDYERAKDSLDRLASTRITTEIETAQIREARGFGLVDSWRIVEEKDGRMIRVSVTLPDWLYRSIEAQAVLTISPDYFRIRSALDRRIYELARKHCGYNKSWKFDLKTLHEKSGSTATLREFRRCIKLLAESDQLPDYMVEYDNEKDQVTFRKRLKIKNAKSKSELKNNSTQTPQPKRKKITEYEAGKMAKLGETWEELLKRIGAEYHVVFDKK